jgi:hypothetical protein
MEKLCCTSGLLWEAERADGALETFLALIICPFQHKRHGTQDKHRCCGKANHSWQDLLHHIYQQQTPTQQSTRLPGHYHHHDTCVGLYNSAQVIECLIMTTSYSPLSVV